MATVKSIRIFDRVPDPPKTAPVDPAAKPTPVDPAAKPTPADPVK